MCTYCIHTDLSTHKAVYVTVPEKAVIVYKIQIRTSKTVPYMHKYTLTERCVHFNPRDKNHFGKGKQYYIHVTACTNICTCMYFSCVEWSPCKCGYQLGIRTYLTFGHRPCAVMCLITCHNAHTCTCTNDGIEIYQVHIYIIHIHIHIHFNNM